MSLIPTVTARAQQPLRQWQTEIRLFVDTQKNERKQTNKHRCRKQHAALYDGLILLLKIYWYRFAVAASSKTTSQFCWTHIGHINDIFLSDFVAVIIFAGKTTVCTIIKDGIDQT